MVSAIVVVGNTMVGVIVLVAAVVKFNTVSVVVVAVMVV